MIPRSDEPTAQAQAIMERLLGLVREPRVVLRALERPGEAGESSSAEAERILYFTLMSAIDAGFLRTMEDALKVLSHASQRLGPMGAEWLERQDQIHSRVKTDDRSRWSMFPASLACSVTIRELARYIGWQ